MGTGLAVLGVLLLVGGILWAQVPVGSWPFASHVDVPSWYDPTPTEPVNPPIIRDHPFQGTFVISEFLDNNRAVWLVEDLITGEQYVLKFKEPTPTHYAVVGHRIQAVGERSAETMQGIPVLLAERVWEYFPDVTGPLPTPLITEVVVLENQLPERLEFAVRGDPAIEGVPLSIMLRVTDGSQTEDVWSERTDRVWDPSASQWVWTMTFNPNNLPSLALQDGVWFVLEVFPTDISQPQIFVKEIR